MKKTSIKKFVSFLCGAALLLTQASAILPANAEGTETKTTLLIEDGFETENTVIKNRIWNYDVGNTNSTVEFVKENENTVLKISKGISSDNFGKGLGLRKANGDSASLSMVAGKDYTFIYSFRYKVESASDYGLVLEPTMCEWPNGYDIGSNWRNNSIVFSSHANACTPNKNEYGLCYGNYDGNWHDVSMAVKITAPKSQNVYPSLYLNFAKAQYGVLYIDDVKISQVADGNTASELCFETNGGNKIDRVAGVTGENAVLPIPANNDNTFAGWYTNAELTTAFDGKFPAESTTLYAKWKGAPKTVLKDNFERDEIGWKDIKNKNATVEILPEEGIEGGSAIYVDATRDSGIVLKPQNTDGSSYKVNSGESLNLIVKFDYLADSDTFKYAQLWLKTIVGDDGYNKLQDLQTVIIGPTVNPPVDAKNWNLFADRPTGEWRTFSFPVKVTANKSGDLMLFFDASSTSGVILVDNLEVTALPSNLKSTAISVNLNDGSTPELVTMVAGEELSQLTVPEKIGYTFTGWYLDKELTEKCETVPETDAQCIALYAGFEPNDYNTVTENYERYSGKDVQSNLSEAFSGNQTFEVEQDVDNKYLHIATDGTQNANKTYWLANSDGTGLNQAFVKDTTYSLLISLKYKINSASGYGLILKPVVCNSDKQWKGAENSWNHVLHFGDIKDASYCYGLKDNEWHTMSLATEFTPSSDYSNTDMGFQIDTGNRTVDVLLDDISVQVLKKGVSATTVNLAGAVSGQTFVAGTVGSYITVDGVKISDTLPKNIYKRAARFTGFAIGNTVFDGTFPAEDGNLTAQFENAVSAYDYNFDKSVDIRDLIHLKKNLANDSDYANSAPDGGVLLAELRKTLLTTDTALTVGGISYTLGYGEEFDGNVVNTAVWEIGNSTDISKDNGIYYKRIVDKNHVSVSDGKAKITFGEDADSTVDVYKDVNGSYYCDPTEEQIEKLGLTLEEKNATLKTIYGGSIRTVNKLEVKYGYIEASVKFPALTIASALWMNAVATPTLRYNEIDVFETFGQDFARTNIHTWDNNSKSEGENSENFHYDWSNGLIEGDSKIMTDIYDGKFHKIGFQWEEDYLKFYCDGELKLTISKNDTNSEYFNAFANTLLYTKLSASPKAGFKGFNGLDSSYEIDYIRYYQNENSEFIMR